MCRCVRVWRASAAYRRAALREETLYLYARRRGPTPRTSYDCKLNSPDQCTNQIAARLSATWCSLKGRCCVSRRRQGEEQEWPHSRRGKAHLNSLHTRLGLYQTTSLLFQFAILI